MAERVALPARHAQSAGTLFHAIVGWPLFWAVSIATALGAAVAQVLALPFDSERRVSLRLIQLGWGTWLWRVIPFWTVRWEGLDRVGPGPYVLVANHVSVLDIPYVMGLPLPVRVVAKPSLFDAPILGSFMRLSRQVRVETTAEDAAAGMLAASRQSLDEGISLLVFPEGTRSDPPRLQRFHRGAFRIAKDTGVPVLPIAIRGTWSILPKHGFLPRSLFVECALRVLDPLDPADFSTARKLSNRAHAAIEGALEDLARDGVDP